MESLKAMLSFFPGNRSFHQQGSLLFKSRQNQQKENGSFSKQNIFEFCTVL